MLRRTKTTQTRKAGSIQISIHICNCVIIIPYSEFFSMPHTARKALLPTSSKKLNERTVYELILVFAITVIRFYIFVVHFRSENFSFHYKIPQYYGLMITHNDLNRSISFHHVYVFVFVFVFVCFSLQTSCINCTHSQ